MSTFNKGDLVILKSGGPVMTIQNMGDYSMSGVKQGVYCVWFTGTKREDAVFDETVLEIYKKG